MLGQKTSLNKFKWLNSYQVYFPLTGMKLEINLHEESWKNMWRLTTTVQKANGSKEEIKEKNLKIQK